MPLLAGGRPGVVDGLYFSFLLVFKVDLAERGTFFSSYQNRYCTSRYIVKPVTSHKGLVDMLKAKTYFETTKRAGPGFHTCR